MPITDLPESQQFKDKSDIDLSKLIRASIKSRDQLKWMIGDALTELERRHPIENRGGKNDQWVNDFCLAIGLHHQKRKELIAVCLFYPPAKRTHALSYEHYRDAMFGSDPSSPNAIARAIVYLDHCVHHSLTVSKLRQHIRQSTRIHSKQSDKSAISSYSPVFAFRRFAKAQVKDNTRITKQRARIILADLGDDVPRLLSTLQRIAAS